MLSFPTSALAAVTEGTKVVCTTTVKQGDGSLTIELWPSSAPVGVQRFVDLVNDGFFTDLPMFRAIPNFLIQFGIQPNSAIQSKWEGAGNIKDDPPSSIPFTDGIVSYAGYGKNSRGTHLFFTLGNQPGLGRSPWEVPVGRVVNGREVMHAIYTGYGDKVNQGRLRGPQGNTYLASFPKLDSFKSCRIEEPTGSLEL